MLHGHLEIIMIMSNEISFIYTNSFSFHLSSRCRNYAYDYKLFCIPTSALTKISFQSSSYVVYIEVSVTTRWLTKIKTLLNDGFVIMNAEKNQFAQLDSFGNDYHHLLVTFVPARTTFFFSDLYLSIFFLREGGKSERTHANWILMWESHISVQWDLAKKLVGTISMM